jgi:holin-like protein
MDWGGVFYQYGLVLLTAVVVSSVLPFFAVGFLTLFLHRRRA